MESFRRNRQKEAIIDLEFDNDCKSFLVSLVIHIIVLLCIASFSIPAPSKHITLTLRFDEISTVEINEDESQGLEALEISYTEVVSDRQQQSETIPDLDETDVSLEVSLEETSELSKQATLLQEIDIEDVSQIIAPNNIDIVNNHSTDNTINEIISSISGGIVANQTSSQALGENLGISGRLKAAGAKEGDVQISMAWNTVDDIDLHVCFTAGNGLVDTINWMNRIGQISTGMLDIDMNANSGFLQPHPVENIFWPHGSSPRGSFSVYVHFYRTWTGNNKVPVIVRIKNRDQIITYNIVAVLYSSPQLVHRFNSE
jgi:hypothetical protein